MARTAGPRSSSKVHAAGRDANNAFVVADTVHADGSRTGVYGASPARVGADAARGRRAQGRGERVMMSYQKAQLERRRRLSAGLRTWGPPGIDLDVAAHEGGHAVVSWLLLLNPIRATIEPGHGFDGMVSFRRAASEMDCEQAYDHAVVSMAGNAAETLLGGS